MDKFTRSQISMFALLLFISILTSGCASTKGGYISISQPQVNQLSKFDCLLIQVNSNNNEDISQIDKERIMRLIIKDIKSDYPDRFKKINDADSPQNTMKADVLITNYDEGSAFARAMLAGLGQMHINAIVSLTDSESNESIAKYDISKTFAWGGLYGGTTGIKDIEKGFAKAVAASIAEKK